MRPQILLFGDSITEQSFRLGGWGAALADTYSRKADVLVRGYGGYNTRWALFLLHHLFPLNVAKPPAAVTIFFGANDAAILGRTSERQHVPIDEYKENLRKIVLHLKECSPTVLIVLITPPPVDEEGRDDFARYIFCSVAALSLVPMLLNVMPSISSFFGSINLCVVSHLPMLTLSWSVMLVFELCLYLYSTTIILS
uniref:SGNH hydrolase-type esterase domain-containing protein n=1 Tax=Cannabis sativa TaxID=3483 RepID=A0A803PA71_CANSA